MAKTLPLTEIQTKFAYLYVRGPIGVAGDVARSYAIAAGREADLEANYKSLSCAGRKTRAKPHIQAYMVELRDELIRQYDVGKMGCIQRFALLSEMAIAKQDIKTARQCQRDIAEMLGHFTTQIAVSHHTADPVMLESKLVSLFQRRPDLIELCLKDHPEMAARLGLTKKIEAQVVETQTLEQ
jgi:hypothetical protein